MCKCNPHIRTLFCGGPGCEWPAEQNYGRPQFCTHRRPAMTCETCEVDRLKARVEELESNERTVDQVRKALEEEYRIGFAELQREHDGALDERNFARQDLEAANAYIAKLERRVAALPEREPSAMSGQAKLVCQNCDTALPEGCSGLFRKDGEACALNAQEHP